MQPKVNTTHTLSNLTDKELYKLLQQQEEYSHSERGSIACEVLRRVVGWNYCGLFTIREMDVVD